jgi:hypothetical protein
MAETTIDTQVAARDARSVLSRTGARIGVWFARIARMSEVARAARHAGELARLSDEQLAARGLTRDGIVAHAFRHLTWR